MSEHRIDQVSIATTGARQTPPNEFGRILAATASSALGAGAAIAGGVVSGSPVLSAAVSGAQSFFGAAAASSPLNPGLAELNGRVQEDRDYDRQYLQLQMDMQRESREFNALSNIIKVRHDSAKAAINNIR